MPAKAARCNCFLSYAQQAPGQAARRWARQAQGGGWAQPSMRQRPPRSCHNGASAGRNSADDVCCCARLTHPLSKAAIAYLHRNRCPHCSDSGRRCDSHLRAPHPRHPFLDASPPVLHQRLVPHPGRPCCTRAICALLLYSPRPPPLLLVVVAVDRCRPQQKLLRSLASRTRLEYTWLPPPGSLRPTPSAKRKTGICWRLPGREPGKRLHDDGGKSAERVKP